MVTILGRSFCFENLPLYHWIEDALIPIIPSAVTCFLVIVRFVRESIQMHRITKQWTINRYMNLLSREGVLYFLVYVFIRPDMTEGSENDIDRP